MNKLTSAVLVLVIVLLLPVVCVADIVELPKCNAQISGDLKGVRIQEGEKKGKYHQYLVHIGKDVVVHVMKLDFPDSALFGKTSDEILDQTIHTVIHTMNKAAYEDADILGIQPTSYNDLPGRIVTINATKVGYLQRTKAFLKDQSVIVASVVGPVNAIGERENQIFESFMFW
nr:hypothetical protein [uncultured Desulfuromonas sp.]